jgi:hypothetical protein
MSGEHDEVGEAEGEAKVVEGALNVAHTVSFR